MHGFVDWVDSDITERRFGEERIRKRGKRIFFDCSCHICTPKAARNVMM